MIKTRILAENSIKILNFATEKVILQRRNNNLTSIASSARYRIDN